MTDGGVPITQATPYPPASGDSALVLPSGLPAAVTQQPSAQLIKATHLPPQKVELFRNRVRGGKGYLLIDDTASGGQKRQYDTLTCCHCNCVVVLNPQRKRARNWCRKCNHYVCDKAICITECNPIQQALELIAKYDDNQAYLQRGNQGEVLFDQSRAQKQKVYGGVSLSQA